MGRALIALSLLVPSGLLIAFQLNPSLDVEFHDPLFHFYVVTFTSFAAAVVAIFTVITLGSSSAPRHTLMAAAFAAMGATFVIHGVTTPDALIAGFHPAIAWAAWLTLLVGGALFALAARDDPRRAGRRLRPRPIIGLVIGAYSVFALVAALAPGVLSAIDQRAAPLHTRIVFALTLLLWGYAAFRFWRTWRTTRARVDGAMALVGTWLTLSTISLHLFPIWHLSWWLYHLLLLVGFLTATTALAGEYERLRQFNLTRYYVTAGLIITAAIALLASDLFTRFISTRLSVLGAAGIEEVVSEVTPAPALVEARQTGLLAAILTMGLLFAALLSVVRRADRLLTARRNELAHAYADLRTAETMRDDLTDMLVHDLRTPLTTITVNLDLMERVAEDPLHRHSQGRFLANARDSARRMIGLINDLLDVSRLEAGQLQPMRERLAITVLLHDRAEAFATQAEADGKHIAVTAPEDLPLVLADPALVNRVLDNLISNALKYTDPGGRVMLSAEMDRQAVVVRVQDDGEGIPPEYTERIFDKFTQVTRAGGAPLRKGSGLGLTFCKLAVEGHGGRIWVRSIPGQGSTFLFTLPVL